MPIPISHSIDTFSDNYKTIELLIQAIRNSTREAIWTFRLMEHVKVRHIDITDVVVLNTETLNEDNIERNW